MCTTKNDLFDFFCGNGVNDNKDRHFSVLNTVQNATETEKLALENLRLAFVYINYLAEKLWSIATPHAQIKTQLPQEKATPTPALTSALIFGRK